MDCVTGEGDTVILYCAELHWRGLHAAYSNLLSAIDSQATSRSSMGRYRIECEDGRIAVELPRLQVEGEWKSAAAAVQETVFPGPDGTSPDGSALWECLQPQATVRVQLGQRELTGLGYLERLTLTLPPWQLPLRELRWGRFVSPTDHVIWIDWQGPYSTAFAIHNGCKRRLELVTETEVAIESGTLRMSDSLPLRAGRLGATVLPGAPMLRRLLPRSLGNIEEHKWRSRGVLETASGQSEGWVIHEVVHWKV
jgi:hypothetical protein